MNVIDIKGKRSSIATYPLLELPIANYQGASFIYGRLNAPCLEDLGLVTNTRKKLPDSELSRAVLQWIAKQVDLWADELVGEAGREEQARETAAMGALNKALNQWKNGLLRRFFIEVPKGPDEGNGVGGAGSGAGGGSGSGEGGTDRGRKGGGDGDGTGGGAGEEKKRISRFPVVLVSGYEADPDTGLTIKLDPRQSVIYQRPTDVNRNIWWINAQRPLAAKIIHEYGVKSPRWRDYHFQRYADVIVNYYLSEKWSQESTHNPDLVAEWIMECVGKIQDSAAQELSEFLFGELDRHIDDDDAGLDGDGSDG